MSGWVAFENLPLPLVLAANDIPLKNGRESRFGLEYGVGRDGNLTGEVRAGKSPRVEAFLKAILGEDRSNSKTSIVDRYTSMDHGAGFHLNKE